MRQPLPLVRALLAGASLVVLACGGVTTRVTPGPDASMDGAVASGDAGTPADGSPSLVPPDASVFFPDAGRPDADHVFPDASDYCGPASALVGQGCGDPSSDPHNCGGCGHDCDGGMCDAGVCAPLPPGVVATGQYAPTAIAVDSENVYWLNSGVVVAGGGHLDPEVFGGSQVLQCAIGGCGNRPTVLASISESAASTKAQDPPSGLTIDDRAVYWTDGAGVHACKKGGCACAPQTLTGVSTATAVAVSPTDAYFALYLPDAVDVCPLAGCAAGPSSFASDQIAPMAIISDTSSVYWSTIGGVRQCPLGGCDGGAAHLWEDPGPQTFTMGIAVDADNVYWTNQNGSVYQCAKTNCATTLVTLADGRNAPSGIASDGTDVYWSDSAGVVKCAVGGCGGVPTVVAPSASPAVAVDATHLAFTQLRASETDGWIVVVAK